MTEINTVMEIFVSSNYQIKLYKIIVLTVALGSTQAPLSKRRRTTSKCPLDEALWSGVDPI